MASKNHYGVLPHYVLSSKLSDGEKIVCGVIDGFTKAYGTCDIDNEYFAKIMNISIDAVKQRISRLYKKEIIANTGTKQNRKLKLNYITPEIKIKELKILDDIRAEFEELWKSEVKKEAKEEAWKAYKKLSKKKRDQLRNARAVYLAELQDQTYASLLRTFIKKEHYLDEKYQEEIKTEQKEESDKDFEIFLKKSLQLSAVASKNPKIKELDFGKISQNEAEFFSGEESKCLVMAVGDVAGLCDQAYSSGNLRSLLGTFWRNDG